MRPLIFLLLSAASLWPQRPSRPFPPIPTAEVRRASKPLVIDGKLDDSAWTAAQPFTLLFPWDSQTGAKQKTVVRLLWDDDYLYAGYECDDADITARFDTHDDPTYRDDAVEFFINPKPSQSFYYGLEMNARAVLYDYAFVYPHILLQRYDFTGVKLATHLRGTLNAGGDTDSGWSLEVAIPWRNFEEIGGKMPPQPGAVWTANLNRWDGAEPHRRLSVWSDSAQPDPNPHNPARFGRLVFVGPQARGPILPAPDAAFLLDQARRIVASARLAPGQVNGKWKNNTPYAVHVPGGNMGYPAYWIRDSVMMLGSDLVSARDVEDWIRLISSTIRHQDWNVRPGVVVPAWAIPDHINFDGKPTYYPGNYETGEAQGGGNWGKYPPLDDHFYFIKAVYEHWRMTGSTALLQSQVKTASGEARLADLCLRAYHVAPVDPATGLCIAGDIHTENAKDFGFCDAESKSGKLLFTSVLKLVVARELAAMFQAIGDTGRAAAFHKDSERIKSAIPNVFFHPSQPDEGWLHSATDVGNQPDVWGSAFALQSNAVDEATALKVGRALVRAYREKTAVREGCVRHILSNWQVSLSPPGEYQNGGYWGTPVGWYIAAIAPVDRTAAEDLARDYIAFLRSHQAWEWFNPETGKTANPLYAATVALPYVVLRQSGLL